MKLHKKWLISIFMFFPYLALANETGYLGDYDIKDPSVAEKFGSPAFSTIDESRSKFTSQINIASSHSVIPVHNSSTPNTADRLPESVGDIAIATGTYGVYYSTCIGSVTCWKLISGTTQAPAPPPPAPATSVTIPTGTYAAWFLSESTGGATVFEYFFSTRTGVLSGTIVANSTGGARGASAFSNKPAGGYVSIPNDSSWMSPTAGAGTVGAGTIYICVEPRQVGSKIGHPLGFYSHEDNSGTKYEHTIFQQSGNQVNSRLSGSAGSGASTFISSAGVINEGKRNSIIVRIAKEQANGARTKMWVNTNLMSGSPTDDNGVTTVNADIDMRFGLQGADATAYADSNMSIYFFQSGHPTALDITTFHADCNALTSQ